MIKKTLKLALEQKHLREKFIREVRVNGLKKAIIKALKKGNEGSLHRTNYKMNEGCSFYDELFSKTGKSDSYVPIYEHKDKIETDIKLITFYLPQFHPIPQNDMAWGKGFTEWTNVSKAIPQFQGHYQPKLPGELGFYDLRLIEIQKRQIELAKMYGIHGFCYHHYWFDGKRVMDQPIEQLLAHQELDFPFCINWANENWTKKWDGYDSDVLLAQNHSPEDDLAFIADAARYMRDSRYIRVEGKPLLMLYRPALLPDPKGTADRWRKWCRENGIGEIYLVTTHSFEHINPNTIGFDAAVEFAPNSHNACDITDIMSSKIINSHYQGNLYDFNTLVKDSNSYVLPGYTKFRSICPNWDNEARKPGHGTTFVGSTPEVYGQWLQTLCSFTAKHFPEKQQFIFINAWNEWAEGAYLEADREYGYAYLEETKRTLLTHQWLEKNFIAIAIHAFYIDVFNEILDYLKDIPIKAKLFITTTAEHEKYIQTSCQTLGFEFEVIVVQNRGRDILPFLKVLPLIEEQNFQIILKIHTKKSKHRNDGDIWRKDLFDKLLSPINMLAILKLLINESNTGIITPEGHLVSMSTYWGSNKRTVLKLAEQVNVSAEEVMKLPFVAGTMFFAKTKAFRSLLSLDIKDDNFEDEKGQVDGTLAHALERFMAISAHSQQLTTQSVHSNIGSNSYTFAD